MKYNEDYYERGQELGISGYSNYRWLPGLTVPMCKTIADDLFLDKNSSILDFGCAKGFLVKAFKDLGYDSYGIDVSEYAIKNCHPDVSDRCKLYTGKSISEAFDKRFNFVLSKDVFEHIPYEVIDKVLIDIRNHTDRLYTIVPLGTNGKYIIPSYENDVTHIIREPMDWWVEKIRKAGFHVKTATYQHKGIKDNWSSWEFGNAFIDAV